MTINLKLMKHQMEKIGFNSNKMANYADVSYSVIHSLLSGKSKLENVSLKVYRSFESLFTRTELIKASDPYVTADQYEAFWFDTLEEALAAKDVKIERSGAPTVVPREEGGYYQPLPVYTQINWRYRDGRPTLSLRIWDEQLYRDMNNKGQQDKQKLVKLWKEVQ